MTGNRVEELEETVRRLEATVDGLTDELVETKERLHAIEEEMDVEPDIIDGESIDDPLGGTADGTSGDEDTSAEDGSADAVNNEEGEGEDNADSGDDIIVA